MDVEVEYGIQKVSLAAGSRLGSIYRARLTHFLASHPQDKTEAEFNAYVAGCPELRQIMSDFVTSWSVIPCSDTTASVLSPRHMLTPHALPTVSRSLTVKPADVRAYATHYFAKLDPALATTESGAAPLHWSAGTFGK